MRSLLLGVSVLAVACTDTSRPSPFAPTGDGGVEAALDAAEGSVANDGGVTEGTAGDGAPGEWGGPCEDDGQCNDDLDCTGDRCESGRCHFTPGAAACDDGIYCNGPERCVPGQGCKPGEPVACSDGTACTIDACDEATHACQHSARDADGDGDPDGNCPPGRDCNDMDPNVSSLVSEICGNKVDDDCDGTVDEKDCTTPLYDTCAAALEVTASGEVSLSARAASSDYTASCIPKGGQFRDLVAAVHAPPGPPVDVDVILTAASTRVVVAAVGTCGDASSEVACGADATTPDKRHVGRVLLRGLTEGVYPVYLFADSEDPLTLDVEFRDATAAPTNETCGTALALAPGVPTLARLLGATADLDTACGEPVSDLVYTFALTEARDVHAYATSKDGFGAPVLSLRDGGCADLSDELTCSAVTAAEVFRRGLPAGRYFLSVGATGPTEVTVDLETSAPTPPPADDSCDGAPELTPNRTLAVELAGHEDDIRDGCSVGMPDAAYTLGLSKKSDVLLVEAISGGDRGAVSLADASCTKAAPCGTSSDSPVRAAAPGVAAGDHRVVVESAAGSPVSVTALVRPAVPPVLVAFADGCSDAVEIAASGGFFQGNTANATDDFTASCDVGGVGGSPDQMLHLALSSRRRVVLDSRGSSYATIVDLRQGACPGDEVPEACSAGYARDRSYVDVTLGPGDYFVQIDGYGSDSGAWVLDVYVVDP